jgi:hypothetical protein
VLNVLKKEKAHEQFATQENVRVMDYQACIQARKTGNDQEVAKRCDQIWKEIRSNNTNNSLPSCPVAQRFRATRSNNRQKKANLAAGSV